MKPLDKVLNDIRRHKDVFLKLVRRAVPQVTVSTENPPLNCLKCSSFCCTLAGYVEARGPDRKRLADHLGLTLREFEEKHIVEVTRKGEKLIKSASEPCQFLGEDRRCTVYSARPRDCREYVCWDQYDTTVYDFAYFYQKAIGTQQRAWNKKKAAEEDERREKRAKQRRKRARAH
jgi:Fe-S-cluster containining protein